MTLSLQIHISDVPDASSGRSRAAASASGPSGAAGATSSGMRPCGASREKEESDMPSHQTRVVRTPAVRDLMTDHVFTLQPIDDLEKLYDLMDAHHIRHVPIVDRDGDLVGLVTQRDLARSALGTQDVLPLSVQQEILRRRKVREIMATEVETVEPDEDLKVAAQMLLENKIGCLPVVEGEHLVGILTESDFVRRYVERG